MENMLLLLWGLYNLRLGSWLDEEETSRHNSWESARKEKVWDGWQSDQARSADGVQGWAMKTVSTEDIYLIWLIKRQGSNF